jgi:undecaprenyl-phosphate 4-deoxy-4-formamido-L-arabinose transferase
MLRAYRRSIVDLIVQSPGATPFVPELAWHFSARPGEVEVRHEARGEGVSNYNLFRLFRLYADLMAASSIAPLQTITMLALAAFGLCSLWLGISTVQWLLGGLRYALLVSVLHNWLISLVLLALGLVGEYVGRIYLEVRARPHYVIKQPQQH